MLGGGDFVGCLAQMTCTRRLIGGRAMCTSITDVAHHHISSHMNRSSRVLVVWVLCYTGALLVSDFSNISIWFR